jgi:hypothetical protein
MCLELSIDSSIFCHLGALPHGAAVPMRVRATMIILLFHLVSSPLLALLLVTT